MKFCIFSDVHGNDAALEAMLAAEEGQCDTFVFAGDIFGYFYGQEAIIDRMMDMNNLIAVRGNHEQYYLSRADREALTDRYGSSYMTVLDERRRQFLERLPVSAEAEAGGKKLLVLHGDPEDPLEGRVYPDTAPDTIRSTRCDYLILGHTHYRMARSVGSCLIINPGSLGQPRDGNGCSYCVLDTTDDSYVFRTVPVNPRDLLDEVRARDGAHSVYHYLMRKYGEET